MIHARILDLAMNSLSDLKKKLFCDPYFLISLNDSSTTIFDLKLWTTPKAICPWLLTTCRFVHVWFCCKLYILLWLVLLFFYLHYRTKVQSIVLHWHHLTGMRQTLKFWVLQLSTLLLPSGNYKWSDHCILSIKLWYSASSVDYLNSSVGRYPIFCKRLLQKSCNTIIAILHIKNWSHNYVA